HQCLALFPSVLPISATSQCCQSVPPISVHQCLLINAHKCRLISATSLVQPISAHQCCLSMPPHQCPPVLPISAHQCCLSVHPHQRTSV
ncbi:unnamed protein product, partial [Staurois parvus]